LPAPNFKSSSGNAVLTRDVNQLDSFTVFTNLPTEMRLKIWRSTFNPRHLKLDLSHHFSESPVDPNDAAMKEDPQDPPATFFVNRESREETLKYYCIIWRTDAICPTKPYTEKPFCICPSIDSVVSRHRSTFFQPNFNIATVHILPMGPSRSRGLFDALFLVQAPVQLTSRRPQIVSYHRVSRRPLGIPAVPCPSPCSDIPSCLECSPPKHGQGIQRNEASLCLCRLNLGRIHLPSRLP
jgi:hypothetical protein